MSSTPAEPAAPEFAELVDGALWWAEQWDLPVFPLHGVKLDSEGVAHCTCPLGAECTNSGKHPRITDFGNAATTDPERIRQWWAMWPDANVGLLTGGPLQVVDIDSALGERNLTEFWAPPPTLEVRTAKGRHLYFIAPEDFRAGNTQGGQGERNLGKGIDTRGDGGYVVTAPSRHYSGVQYSVIVRDPVELPVAMAARLQSVALPRLLPPTVEQRAQHPHAGRQYSEMVTTVVNRIRIATSGRRHMTILSGVRWLAGYFHLQEDLSADAVFDFLNNAINEAYPDDVGRRGGYRAALDAWNNGLAAPFRGLPGTSNRIEEEDERPYMLSQTTGYWIATSGQDRSDGRGSFAFYPPHKVRGAMQYEWPGIRTWAAKVDGDGSRPMKPEELFDYYGQAYVESVLYTYNGRAVYDAETRTITLPARFRSPPEPQFHQEIDDWLRLITPHSDDTEKLLDWLATAPLVDLPTSALVITGPGGIGKQMIVLGLCEYFGVKPVDYDIAVSQYNWLLSTSPVVWLDEVARQLGKTGGFRRLVANSSHPIEQKYQPAGILEGSPRLLAFANGPDPFGLAREDLTLDDEEAIGGRLLHIDARAGGAKTHLERIGGRRATMRARWVEEKIPQHIRWLLENRKVEYPGSRLLVPGDAAKWARRVAARTGTRGQILEFLRLEVERLQDGTATNFTGTDRSCYLEGDFVWVNNKALRQSWQRVFDEAPPTHIRIAAALRGLSKVEDPIRKRFGTARPECFPVPLDLVKASKEDGSEY